jgi:cell division protein FtsI (penicillin-binding protein 3)
VNIKKSILIRVRIAFLAVVVFALCVGAKVGHIQFVEGEKWIRMGNDISFDYKKVKATRGNIYSDNGSLLATSLPFYKVAMDPTLAKDEVFKEGIDSLAFLLSRYYKDRSATDYKRMIRDARETDKRYLVLNRKQISYQTKKDMSRWPIFREGRLRGGVLFEKMDVRYRPLSMKTAKALALSTVLRTHWADRMVKHCSRKLPAEHGSLYSMPTTSSPSTDWMCRLRSTSIFRMLPRRHCMMPCKVTMPMRAPWW